MGIPNRFELKYANVAATDDGDNTVISNTNTAKQIVVLGYALNVNAAGVIVIQDSDNTDLASFELVDGGGVSFAGSFDCPAFQCPRGKNLEISNAAGVDTLGHITYVLVR